MMMMMDRKVALALLVFAVIAVTGQQHQPTFPSPTSFQLFPDIGFRHKFSVVADETLGYERDGGHDWDPTFPMRAFGAPGVALFDYDNDGDVDIYVTNGPGRANSLFQNLLQETGALNFMDVAASAGVAVTEESTGVCYGDIDNDGDQELFIMIRYQPWKMFRNNGDGTFTEVITPTDNNPSGLTATHCTLGDMDNDGFLDLFVARTFDHKDSIAIYVEPFALNEHNSLYRNQGPGASPLFVDVSFSSGSRPPNAPANISWAATFVDLDIDGDVDLMVANDIAGINPALSRERGKSNILMNNGTGFFMENRTRQPNLAEGAHMGFAYGDFNCDSNTDYFSSNIGDWLPPSMVVFRGVGAYPKGFLASDWYLGSDNGTFTRPGVGPFIDASPFSWGGNSLDMDNDGDQDLIYLGGLANGPQTDVNPGAVLENIGSCTGKFRRVLGFALGHYSRRVVSGNAVADLNNDGWPDIVAVSDHEVPPNGTLVPYHTLLEPYFNWTSPFNEDYTVFWPWESGFTAGRWRGQPEQEGRLYLELNNPTATTKTNNWISLGTRGSKGLLPTGRVNRDGVGAVLMVTPKTGKTTMYFQTAGAGYGSSGSQMITMGLGKDTTASVNVLWPGGTWNSFNLNKGERMILPEIPCCYKAFTNDRQGMRSCLTRELGALQRAGHITPDQKGRYITSNFNAWRRFNGENVD